MSDSPSSNIPALQYSGYFCLANHSAAASKASFSEASRTGCAPKTFSRPIWFSSPAFSNFCMTWDSTPASIKRLPDPRNFLAYRSSHLRAVLDAGNQADPGRGQGNRAGQGADSEGLPYQTLRSSIVHKFVTDQLVDRKSILKSIELLKAQNNSI